MKRPLRLLTALSILALLIAVTFLTGGPPGETERNYVVGYREEGR